MNVEAHEFDTAINDLQFAPDRTYFITAGKDKTARVGFPRFPSIPSCLSLTTAD